MSKLSIYYKNLRIFCLVTLFIFDLFIGWQYYCNSTLFEFQIKPEQIIEGQGYSYQIPLITLANVHYPFELIFDDNEYPQRSNLNFYEEGKKLGPPHSYHQDIFDQGNGAHSFWSNYLLFSTSDNTDPRTNGRTYTITSSRVFHESVLIVNILGLLIVFSFLADYIKFNQWKKYVTRTLTLKKLLTYSLIALAIFDIFVAWQFYYTPEYELEITADFIEKGHGFSYETSSFSLPKTQYPFDKLSFDDNEAPFKSSLVLYEDGKPLGPAHSNHQHIFDKGDGRYSFWSSYLLFSTSDNTDPRTNGRTYTITSPYALHNFVFLLNVLGGILLVIWGILKFNLKPKHVSWLIILPAIAYINYTIFMITQGTLCLSPDSAGYVGFSMARTLGYPLFIQMIMNTVGDLRGMAPFQLNLLLSSFVALGYALKRLTNSSWLGLIFTLLLFSILPLLQFSYMILTEATFTAFLCFHFASVALYLKKRSTKYALLSGITLVTAILIRPAGYPLVAGVVLLLLLLPKQRKLTVAAVAGPFILGVLAASTFYFYKFGVFGTQSLGGFALYGQAAFVLESGDGRGTEYEKLIHDLVKKNDTVTSNFHDSSYPREYWLNTLNSYNTMVWQFATPIISEYVATNYPEMDYNEHLDKLNTVAMDVALIGIKSHPIQYARHVLAHYYGAWQGFLWPDGLLSSHILVCHKATIKQVKEIVPDLYKNLMDLSDFTEEGLVKYEERSGQKTWLDRIWLKQIEQRDWLLDLLVICAFLGLGFIFFARANPMNGFIFYMAILLHAYLVFVASVQATLERYSLVFTPILYLLSFLIIFLICKSLLPIRKKLLKDKD